MRQVLINGGKKLYGEIDISGSKNASMPILISTILLNGESVINNIPKLSDTENTLELLRLLNASVKIKENNGAMGVIASVNTESINSFEAPEEIVNQFRASFWVLGPLLAKYGKCKLYSPGGCAIGLRPVDIYLDVIPKMGVEITENGKCITAKSIGKRLKGANIILRLPSVGVTHTLIMAATLAEGKTVIRNAAKEPEVVDLGNFLIKAGAKIKGLGTNILEIEGVESLNGQEYTVMADRIEAFSYLISSLITDGDMVIKGAKFFEILQTPLDILRDMGATITRIDNSTIRVIGNKKAMKGANIKTDFFPGFPTDCQPLITPLLASINSGSTINETIYENRFKHNLELIKMGANIKIENNNIAYIDGKLNSLHGSTVVASDIRAGMCLVLAGLAAEGTTVIENIQYLERGYEKLTEKLRRIGADIVIE
jgi:UDP-N-acetylglucosamine 1-carboxyvinyltransferase